MTSLTDKQFNELKDFLSNQQNELVLLSHQSKDKEISSLHSEILKKIDVLNNKISSHDELISVVANMLPEIKEAVKAYKNTSIITKALIGIIIGTPAIAGFIAGIIYMLGLLHTNKI
jgi:predicted translin family RNA/ssDNA-binding protein